MTLQSEMTPIKTAKKQYFLYSFLNSIQFNVMAAANRRSDRFFFCLNAVCVCVPNGLTDGFRKRNGCLPQTKVKRFRIHRVANDRECSAEPFVSGAALIVDRRPLYAERRSSPVSCGVFYRCTSRSVAAVRPQTNTPTAQTSCVVRDVAGSPGYAPAPAASLLHDRFRRREFVAASGGCS